MKEEGFMRSVPENPQEPIPDMFPELIDGGEQTSEPAVTRTAIDLKARNSLSRLLTPEYFGINPTEYEDISPVLIARAHASSLRPSLIDLPRHSRSSLRYLPPDRGPLVRVAVLNKEFRLATGSFEMLSQVTTAIQNGYLENQPPDLEKSAAADRAGRHAVEVKADKIKEYVDDTLGLQKRLIGKFSESAKHPGLSRGAELTMRLDFALLRSTVVESVIQALRIQRRWKDEQEDRARRSIEASFFLDRTGNRHIGNFAAMMTLAQEWNGYKEAILKTRYYQAKTYIGELLASEAQTIAQ
jgi:hypothetical protein